MPRSISSRLTVSGGAMRQIEAIAPTETMFMDEPSSMQRAVMARPVATSSTRVSRSCTSSTPWSSPKPRTSPWSSCRCSPSGLMRQTSLVEERRISWLIVTIKE